MSSRIIGLVVISLLSTTAWATNGRMIPPKKNIGQQFSSEISVEVPRKGLSSFSKRQKKRILYFNRSFAALMFSLSVGVATPAMSIPGSSDSSFALKRANRNLYAWDHNSGGLTFLRPNGSHMVRVKLLMFLRDDPETSLLVKNFFVLGARGVFNLFDHREKFAELTPMHDYFMQITPYHRGEAVPQQRSIIGRRSHEPDVPYKKWQIKTLNSPDQTMRGIIVSYLEKELKFGYEHVIDEGDPAGKADELELKTRAIIKRLNQKSILDRISL